MEVEELPNMNVDEIINEISSEETQTTQLPTGDVATDMSTEHYRDGLAVAIKEYLLYTPSATSSKSKHVSRDTKKKEIQEFFRVIRPHLPRESKTKAYKMLQNIAKGTVAKSSFERRIRTKKPKKRPVRKQKTRQFQTKSRQFQTKSLSIVRKNRSLYDSSDSCRSITSCSHCGGYSWPRIARC